MSDLRTQGAIARARAAASAASFDAQKLPEDSIERQAIHNIVTAIDALIDAVDTADDDESATETA